MAITQTFSSYTKILEVDVDWMIQVDLSEQRISKVTDVYTKPIGIPEVNKFTESENIEKDFADNAGSTTAQGYYQYKNNILYIASIYNYAGYDSDEFWFAGKRFAEPIKSLDDDIDIPQNKVPLFVNKVLANIYHLQGKEVPITIKRRIKELES